MSLRRTWAPPASYTASGFTIDLRSSAAASTSRLKSSSICRVVSTPTIVANPSRITSVSRAEPPASRQRIGSRLYAEDVACAADRMKEPGLATMHLMRVRVEGQVADAQRGHAARRPPPQQRAQPREQLLPLERLHEVVVGADVEALDARVERVAGGQHQDRRVVLVPAQPARDVDPVHAREPEVEHQHVRQERVHLVERRDPVAGEPDLVALEPQRALQHLGYLLVVLHHEDAYGPVGCLHMQEEIMAAALAPANAAGGEERATS